MAQALQPGCVPRRRGHHHRDQRGCQCAALHQRCAERFERQVERVEARFEARAGGAADGALRTDGEVLEALEAWARHL